MKTLENELKNLLDNGSYTYKIFSSSLLPGIPLKSILGIKLPVLKVFTKELININSKEEIEEFMDSLPHKYLEENIIHGYIISMIKDVDIVFSCLDKFIPYADNWEVTDTIKPNCFKKHVNKLRLKVYEYLKSDHPFTVRFAIVMMLSYLVKDNFNKEDLVMLEKVKSDHYYVKMALAWYYSYLVIFNYDDIIEKIESKSFDPFVHKMTIQKSIDSFRVSNEKKIYLRSLR